MIVLDTSAVVNLLVGDEARPGLTARVTDAASIHAPHLLDTEVVSALRGLVLGKHLSVRRAEAALHDFLDLPVVRYPATPLLSDVWRRRGAHTAYDATFIALAAALGCPLVTCDGKTRRARGVDVEVF
ncbi:type II toxin-antitoxin system VapC family toxin [Nocardioides sp. 1609]|uniref:type II toxin-antitoxin system VapC family toxin n=1 Tax=Nocardioides sp. 1609 TaxID=2508327 RepID=UPI0010703D1B|nr:type II toxin-antitoxin system VapC family toxin [Nocardioides sp. 1609]